MATRRCLHALRHHAAAAVAVRHSVGRSFSALASHSGGSLSRSVLELETTPFRIGHLGASSSWRCYCSGKTPEDEGSEDEYEESEEEEGEIDEVSDGEIAAGPGLQKRDYTPEEKEAVANEIGYKVIGPLERSDRVFKPYEPVFAVVQVGSHQFKVSNRDCIFTERLKFCEVNDKIILNKVLLLGSPTQTIVGRPNVPDAAVHAVVEEHALDAKVIIFKKKRRKNYRRTKGHRQELTKLRITDIQGIEKPEIPEPKKPVKIKVKRDTDKQEKVAVPA
ncbi:hypothetical protein MLD38_037009 [Melastoma candidum]|uniref:Uncharacterized protein n=1 Tax=Melastoma candidum TaxID=119954 RepID=A0ACB9LM49_9MYRT|nr:hypothetical protein MLD38_037009 [Melastoma candidum]